MFLVSYANCWRGIPACCYCTTDKSTFTFFVTISIFLIITNKISIKIVTNTILNISNIYMYPLSCNRLGVNTIMLPLKLYPCFNRGNYDCRIDYFKIKPKDGIRCIKKGDVGMRGIIINNA